MQRSWQQSLQVDDPESRTRNGGLKIVHATAKSVSPFDSSLFDGFTSMRALTYTSSIPMVLRLLRDKDFDRFECIFGHEGVLSREAASILGFQAAIDESLNTAFLSLEGITDDRRTFIYDRVANGHVRFRVVKDVIAHAKIYLLERDDLRRVVVGSANLSETAFSGRQAETLIVFDCDSSETDLAWEHYTQQYEDILAISSSTLPLRKEVVKIESFRMEEIPTLREANATPEGLTIYIPNAEPLEEAVSMSQILRKVERVQPVIKRALAEIHPDKTGRVKFVPNIVKQMTRIVQSRETEDAPATYLSIEGDRFVLSGEELPLDPNPDEVASDVACWVEFFNNYNNGFQGDIQRLQRDYFTFMAWFYFSPFMCDLRNGALRNGRFSFDQPLFAVLYGSSNCGKTSLVETLMQSMFSYPRIVETQDFTRSRLRGLQQAYRRFPIVFDDVTRARFNTHAPEIIKDESIPYGEYPCFALSMNAEVRNFPDEIIKRCLMIYTRTALRGDDSAARRRLQRSVAAIRSRITTACYREYLRRTLNRVRTDLDSGEEEPDALELSSRVLHDVISEYSPNGEAPSWCRTVTLEEYQDKAFERPRLVLRNLLSPDRYSREHVPNEGLWTIAGDSIAVSVSPTRLLAAKADIPDWIMDDTGSVSGQILLKREPLEAFLNQRIRHPRRWFGLV